LKEHKNKPALPVARPLLKGGFMTHSNHRQFPRAPMSGAVKFFDWNQARHAEGTEISGGGIFLRTREVLAEGAMVTVRVTLPGLKRAFTVLGKVVRTVKGGIFSPPGMGVRFVDLSPGDRQTILEYVARRSPQLLAEAV
jgi:uncharacterized protein (TIGR02266 family)